MIEIPPDDIPGDDELMERLRAIGGQVDPPPATVLAAAQAALATRRLDAELAELMLDSHEPAGAGVRAGAAEVRVLSFESATVTIELQVRALPAGAALRGLVDGATGPVILESGDDRREVAVDEEGWFTVDGVPAGLVRLRATAVGGAPVVSSWVSL